MECATEVGKSIACKASCESHVAAVDAVVNKSIVTVETQKKNRMFMPLFFATTGASILALSIYKTGSVGLSSIMGFVFIGFGIVNYLINRKWVKELDAAK